MSTWQSQSFNNLKNGHSTISQSLSNLKNRHSTISCLLTISGMDIQQSHSLSTISSMGAQQSQSLNNFKNWYSRISQFFSNLKNEHSTISQSLNNLKSSTISWKKRKRNVGEKVPPGPGEAAWAGWTALCWWSSVHRKDTLSARIPARCSTTWMSYAPFCPSWGTSPLKENIKSNQSSHTQLGQTRKSINLTNRSTDQWINKYESTIHQPTHPPIQTLTLHTFGYSPIHLKSQTI